MSERGGSDRERLWMTSSSIDFESVQKFTIFTVRRIRPFPTLISKNKWLGSELPLNFFGQNKKNLWWTSLKLIWFKCAFSLKFFVFISTNWHTPSDIWHGHLRSSDKKRWNCPILRKFQIQKSYLKVFDTFTSLAEAVSDLKFEKWIRNVLN